MASMSLGPNGIHLKSSFYNGTVWNKTNIVIIVNLIFQRFVSYLWSVWVVVFLDSMQITESMVWTLPCTGSY